MYHKVTGFQLPRQLHRYISYILQCKEVFIFKLHQIYAKTFRFKLSKLRNITEIMQSILEISFLIVSVTQILNNPFLLMKEIGFPFSPSYTERKLYSTKKFCYFGTYKCII